MLSDVKVVIKAKEKMKETGFGMPLLLKWEAPVTEGEEGASQVAVPYQECTGLEQVLGIVGEESELGIAAKLLYAQENPPAKIAVCFAVAESLEAALAELMGKGWRQLVLVSGGFNAAAARLVEQTQDKIYFASVSELGAVDGLTGLDGKGFSRTFCLYYKGGTQCPEAAIVGVIAGKAVGSFTYKNLILKSIEPSDFTAKEVEEAHQKGCYTFVRKAGDNVTSEGKTMSGEYLDVVDGADFVLQQIEHQTQKTLNTMDKVPYDNNGIALLESICVNVLQDAANKGIVALDENGQPIYEVNYAPRSATKEEDRAARRYVEGKFSFMLAGAVHTAEINGIIEI